MLYNSIENYSIKDYKRNTDWLFQIVVRILDKGKPLTKEICEACKLEIEPGDTMIIETTCPSHERQLFNRLNDWSFYGYIDNAPKYHEKCYIEKYKKEKRKNLD